MTTSYELDHHRWVEHHGPQPRPAVEGLVAQGGVLLHRGTHDRHLGRQQLPGRGLPQYVVVHRRKVDAQPWRYVAQHRETGSSRADAELGCRLAMTTTPKRGRPVLGLGRDPAGDV